MKSSNPYCYWYFWQGFYPTAYSPKDTENSMTPNFTRKRSRKTCKNSKTATPWFPPRPKSDLSIGVKTGLAFITGDIADYPIAPPGAVGISVRRAFGHAFSLRLEGNTAVTLASTTAKERATSTDALIQ